MNLSRAKAQARADTIIRRIRRVERVKSTEERRTHKMTIETLNGALLTDNLAAAPPPLRAATVYDNLLADDVLFYTMVDERITCACGVETSQTRMWVCYRVDQRTGRNSRPMGKSETFYARKEVKRHTRIGGTPVCDACFATATRQDWTAVARPSPAAGHSNFAVDAAKPKAPRAPRDERPIEDLLGF